MHLKRLKLVNFKSHKDTEVWFDKTRTTFEPKPGIAAPNDIGKSHILRAMKILCFHENYTQDHLFRGEKSGYIELETFEGFIVRRELKGGDQTVTLTKPNGEEVNLTKLNATTIVKEALGIQKFVLDPGSEPTNFNYIGPDDPLMFLKERSDVFLRKMASLVGSHTLETVASEVNSDLKDEKKALEFSKKNKASLEEDLDKVNLNLDKCRQVAELAKQLIDKRSDIQKRAASVEAILDFHKTNTKDALLKSKQDLQTASKLTSIREVLITGKTAVEDLKNRLKDANTKTNDLLKEEEKIKSDIAAEVERLASIKVCEACGKEMD
jgi:chromosome segregation ATPase